MEFFDSKRTGLPMTFVTGNHDPDISEQPGSAERAFHGIKRDALFLDLGNTVETTKQLERGATTADPILRAIPVLDREMWRTHLQHVIYDTKRHSGQRAPSGFASRAVALPHATPPVSELP